MSVLSTVLGTQNSLIAAFSITSNYRKILSRRTPNDLDCIHGLRFLSTCYVIIGHRYLMAMFTPVINGLEILDVILLTPICLFIHLISVDFVLLKYCNNRRYYMCGHVLYAKWSFSKPRLLSICYKKR